MSSKSRVVAVVVASAIAGSQLAFGVNITIFDGVNGGYFGGGTQQAPFEDQEVENGAVPAQVWDLERFDLNGTSLSITAGYNLINGQDAYRPGDLFIDTDGNAVWGNFTLPGDPAELTQNSFFKYDYVVQFDYSALNSGQVPYAVYKIGDNDTLVRTVDFGGTSDDRFDRSNPWKWQKPEGTVPNLTGLSAGYESGLTDADAMAAGGDGTHKRLTLDVGFLGNELDGALFHYTMECGNDNLMGRTSVPEPLNTGVASLGVMLVGWLARRKMVLS